MMDELRLFLAHGLVILSSIVMAIGVYGLVWMPDLYTKAHAASKAVVLGVVPLLGAVVLVGDGIMASRAFLIAVFLLLTTPVAANAIGRAAYLSEEPRSVPLATDESAD